MASRSEFDHKLAEYLDVALEEVEQARHLNSSHHGDILAHPNSMKQKALENEAKESNSEGQKLGQMSNQIFPSGTHYATSPVTIPALEGPIFGHDHHTLYEQNQNGLSANGQVADSV